MTTAPPTTDHRPPATARKRVNRQTVDLSAYPDLVVIYLGMRVNVPTGIKMLAGIGPQIQKAAAGKPDGLLLHENLVYGLFPPHVGMRQYWRDFDSLEQWSRSEPHRRWWQSFLRDSGGTGFWHETYFIRGGFESIYDDLGATIGMMTFAPLVPARGAMFGARRRLHLAGEPTAAPPLSESDLYRREPATTP